MLRRLGEALVIASFVGLAVVPVFFLLLGLVFGPDEMPHPLLAMVSPVVLALALAAMVVAAWIDYVTRE